MCGEQYNMIVIPGISLGSPPRVRGTASFPLPPRPASRITPACAGNSFMAYTTAMLTQDHPRVCGEQSIYVLKFFRLWGSPPRVRGTVFFKRIFYGNRRITPACAGNSYLSLFFTTSIQDHPRVCGEQAPFLAKSCSILGSPPRVRGTGFHPHLSGA